MVETTGSDLLLWITAAKCLLIILPSLCVCERESGRQLICVAALMKAICHWVATLVSAGIMYGCICAYCERGV